MTEPLYIPVEEVRELRENIQQRRAEAARNGKLHSAFTATLLGDTLRVLQSLISRAVPLPTHTPCGGCGQGFDPEAHVYGQKVCCPDCTHFRAVPLPGGDVVGENVSAAATWRRVGEILQSAVPDPYLMDGEQHPGAYLTQPAWNELVMLWQLNMAEEREESG